MCPLRRSFEKRVLLSESASVYEPSHRAIGHVDVEDPARPLQLDMSDGVETDASPRPPSQ